MKLLTNKDRMYGTVKLHNELDILQIQDIFETSVLNFVFKCVKDVPIEPFKTILHSDMNIMTIICEIMKTLQDITKYG